MKLLTVLASLVVAGCITTSGTYLVSAVAKDGSPLPKATTIATGRAIYTVRNGTCIVYPGATVQIVDATTRQNLEGESPYVCPERAAARSSK